MSNPPEVTNPTPPVDQKPPEPEGKMLTYTDCRKIHCGLRWDPVDMTGGAANVADLDLRYVLYDEYGRFIDSVSGKDGMTTDNTGNIYHSGDDADGVEDGDDERITIDLFGTPKSIHYIFLISEISSHHNFGNITNPFIRIVKAAQNQQIAQSDLASLDGAESKAHLFMRLDRQVGGWKLVKLNKFIDGGEIPNWEEFLIDFLPAIAFQKKEQANLPPTPKKGEIVKLGYSPEGRQRVVCGVSWDLRPGGIDNQVDVDVTCIMFDNSGDCVADVSSEASRAIDESGAVYHSGDEVTGDGGGDDEFISVELARLPENIVDLVFFIDMKTDHKLADIRNPTIRIADGKTDLTQLGIKIDQSDKTANAYVFARLAYMEDGWMLHYIGLPLDTAQITDWTETLLPYLTGPTAPAA